METNKYTYGGLIARLIAKGVRVSWLKKALTGGKSIDSRESNAAQQIITQLEEQRNKIVLIRPNADKYLCYPFYCSLRYENEKSLECDELCHYVSYCGGQKRVETKVITSDRDLQNYCRDLDKLLMEREILDKIDEDGFSHLDNLIEKILQEEEDDGGDDKENKKMSE